MKFKFNSKTKKKLLLGVGIALLIIALVLGGVYLFIRAKVYKPLKVENTTVQEVAPNYQEVNGITNVLFIGTDARDVNEPSRSDTMMIVTIDSNRKEIRLTSLMRDTYVDIKGYGKQKLNAAYAIGGAELLFDTVQRNFNFKLDKYVVANFWGFEGMVDDIGGLDIDVKDYEIKEINKFIGENDKVKSPSLTHAGLQHLDGQQVLSYARIREVGNGVYERDSRDRIVISLIFDKLKTTSIFKYTTILTNLLKYVKTDIEPATILNYAYTVSNFKPLQFEQLEIPIADLSDGRIYKGSWELLMDSKQNGKVLNNFILNAKKPDKSDYSILDFKVILNNYLQEELKTNPTLNQNDPKLKIMPAQSDHSIPTVNND